MFVYGVDIPLQDVKQPDEPLRQVESESPVDPTAFSFTYGMDIFPEEKEGES
ncbi:hypothetical protein [Xylanibacillus composti]|uniref:Uncharacterized protein n=1 Tax=Xylanibacillus composti TaxID=1572762 RepID=A0A8J4H506_9BACL|nr:hypothetical protein [Xylanibacillus composti]GIQ71068.1 hypothetical protein XYCOK13_38920 [Xylanibacillus composti]